MLAYRLEDCCVRITGSIAEAMQSLEKSGVEIALVMDREGVMAGVMTDGDVRRALLRGASLETPLKPYIQRKFISVRPDMGRADVLDLMKARVIQQIPVVDQSGRLLG